MSKRLRSVTLILVGCLIFNLGGSSVQSMEWAESRADNALCRPSSPLEQALAARSALIAGRWNWRPVSHVLGLASILVSGTWTATSGLSIRAALVRAAHSLNALDWMEGLFAACWLIAGVIGDGGKSGTSRPNPNVMTEARGLIEEVAASYEAPGHDPDPKRLLALVPYFTELQPLAAALKRLSEENASRDMWGMFWFEDPALQSVRLIREQLGLSVIDEDDINRSGGRFNFRDVRPLARQIKPEEEAFMTPAMLAYERAVLKGIDSHEAMSRDLNISLELSFRRLYLLICCLQSIIRRRTYGPALNLPSLTAREKAILRLIAFGYSIAGETGKGSGYIVNMIRIKSGLRPPDEQHAQRGHPDLFLLIHQSDFLSPSERPTAALLDAIQQEALGFDRPEQRIVFALLGQGLREEDIAERSHWNVPGVSEMIGFMTVYFRSQPSINMHRNQYQISARVAAALFRAYRPDVLSSWIPSATALERMAKARKRSSLLTVYSGGVVSPAKPSELKDAVPPAIRLNEVKAAWAALVAEIPSAMRSGALQALLSGQAVSEGSLRVIEKHIAKIRQSVKNPSNRLDRSTAAASLSRIREVGEKWTAVRQDLPRIPAIAATVALDEALKTGSAISESQLGMIEAYIERQRKIASLRLPKGRRDNEGGRIRIGPMLAIAAMLLSSIILSPSLPWPMVGFPDKTAHAKQDTSRHQSLFVAA